MLRELFLSNQIEFHPIPLDESGIKIKDLEKQKIQIACITPSHQFPTGIIMPIRRRNELLHWANASEERYIVDRKSTRLNSSHANISYAVFCLKKKKNHIHN